MLLSLVLLVAAQGADANVEVQKEIIYQKETNVDLSGSDIKGERDLPPAFFLTKMQTPKADSLLQERLKFRLKDFNRAGF
jgi:hypothetical protein